MEYRRSQVDSKDGDADNAASRRAVDAYGETEKDNIAILGKVNEIQGLLLDITV